MPSGFFVVFRHYLRVDQVIVRVNDTRLYSPKGASYILRETSSREAPISKLRVIFMSFSVLKYFVFSVCNFPFY